MINMNYYIERSTTKNKKQQDFRPNLISNRLYQDIADYPTNCLKKAQKYVCMCVCGVQIKRNSLNNSLSQRDDDLELSRYLLVVRCASDKI